MKKLMKRITAFGLAAVTSLGLCLTAHAQTKTQIFTGITGHKISFGFTVTTQTVASAIYQLTAELEQLETRRFYFPHIYMKGVLYGTGTRNSVMEQTYNNVPEGKVIVSRDKNDCDGKGFGQFRAYGNAEYGDVYGAIYI